MQLGVELLEKFLQIEIFLNVKFVLKLFFDFHFICCKQSTKQLALKSRKTTLLDASKHKNFKLISHKRANSATFIRSLDFFFCCRLILSLLRLNGIKNTVLSLLHSRSRSLGITQCTERDKLFIHYWKFGEWKKMIKSLMNKCNSADVCSFYC